MFSVLGFSAIAGWLAAAIPLLASAQSEERGNLPQIARTITLPDSAAMVVKRGLAQSSDPNAQDLPPEIERLLIENLPSDFRRVCARLMLWEPDQDSVRWKVVRLHQWRERKQTTLVLSFRCWSSPPSANVVYYDERLAVLSMEGGESRLRLIPVGEDCRDCSEFQHLSFGQVFPLQRGELVELRVETSLNPIPEGTIDLKMRHLLYLLLPESQVLLSIERSRDVSDSDAEGSSEYICRSDLTYERDRAGALLGINTTLNCLSDGKAVAGTKRTYRWNRATRRLDEAAPRKQP
jgi:hypothetical protein